MFGFNAFGVDAFAEIKSAANPIRSIRTRDTFLRIAVEPYVRVDETTFRRQAGGVRFKGVKR